MHIILQRFCIWICYFLLAVVFSWPVPGVSGTCLQPLRIFESGPLHQKNWILTRCKRIEFVDAGATPKRQGTPNPILWVFGVHNAQCLFDCYHCNQFVGCVFDTCHIPTHPTQNTTHPPHYDRKSDRMFWLGCVKGDIWQHVTCFPLTLFNFFASPFHRFLFIARPTISITSPSTQALSSHPKKYPRNMSNFLLFRSQTSNGLAFALGSEVCWIVTKTGI